MKTGFVYGHEYQAHNILADMLSYPARDSDYWQDIDQIGGYMSADEAVELVQSLMSPPEDTSWWDSDGFYHSS